jgi:predicted CoA-binding protein
VQKIKAAASEFLGCKRVAVTGVSRSPKGHGGNVVYQWLRERGYQVFAVNPNADEVEGDACYHDLRSIPGGVEAVVIGTKPETAVSTMHECAGSRDNVCLDAPIGRGRQRVSRGDRVWPRPWDHGY